MTETAEKHTNTRQWSTRLGMTVFFLLSTALTVFNRWAFTYQSFSFPVTLTLFHMAYGYIAQFVLGWYVVREKLLENNSHDGDGQGKGAEDERGPMAMPGSSIWRPCIVIGVCLGLTVSLSNAALVETSVALTQIIRSSLPLFSSLCTLVLRHVIPSKREILFLCTIAVGVSIATAHGRQESELGPGSTGRGIVLSLTATAAGAIMSTLTEHLLSHQGLRIPPSTLFLYAAPAAMVVLVPMAAATELTAFLVYMQRAPLMAAFIILFSGSMASAYNAVHSLLLSRTSAVSMSVLSGLKMVVLVLVSSLAFTDHGSSGSVKILQLVGCAIAATGVVLYCIEKNGKGAKMKKPKIH